MQRHDKMLLDPITIYILASYFSIRRVFFEQKPYFYRLKRYSNHECFLHAQTYAIKHADSAVVFTVGCSVFLWNDIRSLIDRMSNAN